MIIIVAVISGAISETAFQKQVVSSIGSDLSSRANTGPIVNGQFIGHM